MNSVIKLYSPESQLSYIADEIYDLRNNIKSLKIQLRDKICLKSREKYELTINRGDFIRVRNSFVYVDSDFIRLPIGHDDELKIQSLRSKKPFQVKILDHNNNCLAMGLFYRYKTRCRFSRSTNPREWDPSFFPERHKIYEKELAVDNDSEFSITSHIPIEYKLIKDKKRRLDEQKQTMTDEDRKTSWFFFQ